MTEPADHPRPSGRHPRPGQVRWIVIVVACGLILAMSAPGQTAGLSVFTDPLIDQLDVSRTEISLSYLIGTLIGAVAQPFTGRALDRFGARSVTLGIGVGFALVLVALSFVAEILGLTAGFVGVRMLGQGALTLAATTAVARAIKTRRGLALGITSAIGSAGISLAPVALEPVIELVGVRSAWRWEAVVVALVVLPLALLLPGRPPKQTGPPSTGTITAIAASWKAGEAARTGMFWVLAGALAATGMLTTALAFHQIAVLGEQGLSPLEAAANFLPQTVTGIVLTLIGGALVDRYDPRIFVVVSMGFLAASLLMLPLVEPGWSAIAYGLVLGAASGSIRGVEAAAYARYFGTAHLGSIRGVATSISLASTAVGPLALALGHDVTGGFVVPAAVFAIFPALVAAAALVVQEPQRRGDSGGRSTRPRHGRSFRR